MLKQRIQKSFEYPSRISILKSMLAGIIVYMIVLMCIVTVVVYLSIFVQVSGSSMNNSLHDRDYLLINRYANNPKINEVVVLKHEGYGLIIKRVVALSGDVIKFEEKYNIEDGNYYVELYRNGKEVKEDYIKEPMKNFPFGDEYSPFGQIGIGTEYTVPIGFVFVMGDNRNDSMDGRSFGFSARYDIRGTMYLKLGKDSWFEWVFKLVYGM